MSNVIFDVQGLTKHFPVTSGFFKSVIGYARALDDVDFTIDKGEVLGVVGESGSGKSTMARAAIRLIEPTAGSIKFLGEDLRTLSDKALLKMRTKIQMVFQDPFASLNPRKTIEDALGEPLRYHGLVHSKEEEVGRVGEMLEQIGLPRDSMWRYPHQFSGGQLQRICIGRALIVNPKLIICDEVVSALDVSVQAQILNLLLDLRRKLDLSYLFISHDLSVIRYVSDKVIVLYLGKIMESGSVEEIFTNPKHPYTQALLASTPRVHPGEERSRMRLHGEIPSNLHPPSGCPFRTRCPYAQPICAEAPPRKVIADRKTGLLDHRYDCVL